MKEAPSQSWYRTEKHRKKKTTVRSMTLPWENPADGLAPQSLSSELEINDYPREARWKVTQRNNVWLQDESGRLSRWKGSYFGLGHLREERKLYLHLEATRNRFSSIVSWRFSDY
jgi:hypothetical protein